MSEINIGNQYGFELPQNIQDFLNSRVSALDVSINKTDALNGYGGKVHFAAKLMILTDRCEKCGYSCHLRRHFLNNYIEHPEHQHKWKTEYIQLCGAMDTTIQGAVSSLAEKFDRIKCELL